MSLNALILGTVDFLRDPTDGLAIAAEQCDEQPDGQPPPWDGEVYYAVSEGDWTSDADEYLDEYLGFEVTITLRAGYAPTDRLQVELKRQLRTRAEAVRAKIHSKAETFLPFVNKYLPPDVNQQFIEPPRFRGCSRTQVRGPEWFWAEADGDDAPSGLSITVRFARARRVQGLDAPMT